MGTAGRAPALPALLLRDSFKGLCCVNVLPKLPAASWDAEVTRRRLYYETMEAILSKTDKTIVESGNVTPYLPLPEIQRRAQQQPAQPKGE